MVKFIILILCFWVYFLFKFDVEFVSILKVIVILIYYFYLIIKVVLILY